MKNNEQIIHEIHTYCLNKAGVYESRPFGAFPLCYRIIRKIYAQFYPQSHFYKLTLKCRPEQGDIYRRLFPASVTRGYHCPPIQQPYWNTIDLGNFSDKELLLQMIDETYEAAAEGLTRKEKALLASLAEFTFKETDGEDPDFALLCHYLDEDLDQLVGAGNRSIYNQYNKRDGIRDAIVVYCQGKPVACGSFKMYDEEHVELKRMFTLLPYRRLGLGGEVVRRLEAKAKIRGYKFCILETGIPLEAACIMYQKAGYKIIPNYGQYADMPNSVCMERKI